jgi:uncharacterized protein YbjT (DUF2867 family)
MNPEHRAFFADADRQLARNFIEAAERAGLKRIIYLGGAGVYGPELSPHLKSRMEVGRILQSESIPVTILNAAIILGSGSASFEILRYFVERFPVMIIPSRVIDTRIQPISIINALKYLSGCLEKEETTGQTYDIGGPDILTYRQLINLYAEITELRKPLIFSPSFLPSFAIGQRIAFFLARIILPLPPSILHPLLEGAVNEVIVRDYRIRKIIHQKLLSCEDVIRRAIKKDSLKIVETRWTDAGNLKPPEWAQEGDAPYAGGTLLRGGFRVKLMASPFDIWNVISRIGGNNGYYYGDILWRIRGWMDTLAGGAGLRRGRRHPEKLFVGDALDFWRVLEVAPPERLILVAEMKLPGEAILEFEINSEENNISELKIATRFRPRGLYGMLYWYAMLPFHNLLFGGMLKAIAKRVKSPVVQKPEKFMPGPFR